VSTKGLPEVPSYRPPKALPKRVGTVADLYYETRQRRLALQKVVDELKKQESLMKAFVIDEVPKSNATGVAGRIARVQVVGKSSPRADNWDDFYKYMFRVKRPELLQKRLSNEAIQELWDDGKTVPGVIEFKFKDISITKL